MAVKRVKKEDLELLLKSALKIALNSDVPGCTISIDSISATIKVINNPIAKNILKDNDYTSNLPFHTFKKILQRHTGENLIPIIVEENKEIIIQVKYDIVD